MSQWAHSLAVEWASKADGQAIAACGVNPYEYAPDPRTVGFVRAKEDFPRCPKCIEAMTTEAAA